MSHRRGALVVGLGQGFMICARFVIVLLLIVAILFCAEILAQYGSCAPALITTRLGSWGGSCWPSRVTAFSRRKTFTSVFASCDTA